MQRRCANVKAVFYGDSNLHGWTLKPLSWVSRSGIQSHCDPCYKCKSKVQEMKWLRGPQTNLSLSGEEGKGKPRRWDGAQRGPSTFSCFWLFRVFLCCLLVCFVHARFFLFGHWKLPGWTVHRCIELQFWGKFDWIRPKILAPCFYEKII